jgi:hypothetical protein
MITNPKRIEKNLRKLGFEIDRHSKHITYTNGLVSIQFPKRKSRDIHPTLYYALIKQVGLTVKEFEAL